MQQHGSRETTRRRLGLADSAVPPRATRVRALPVAGGITTKGTNLNETGQTYAPELVEGSYTISLHWRRLFAPSQQPLTFPGFPLHAPTPTPSLLHLCSCCPSSSPSLRTCVRAWRACVCRCGQVMLAAKILRRLFHHFIHHHHRVSSDSHSSSQRSKRASEHASMCRQSMGTNIGRRTRSQSIVAMLLVLVLLELISRSRRSSWMASASSCKSGSVQRIS